MTSNPRHFFYIVILTLAVSTSQFCGAETLIGKVVRIKDGDTIVMLADNHPVTIRIAGIDAPEKKQPFGQRSKQAMSECAFGKEVMVDWSKSDRYGRTIGKVMADGTDCGLQLVQDGMAWHYKAYAKDQSSVDRDTYSEAESTARTAKLGLWSDPSPEPPWQFRHLRNKPTASAPPSR